MICFYFSVPFVLGTRYSKIFDCMNFGKAKSSPWHVWNELIHCLLQDAILPVGKEKMFVKLIHQSQFALQHLQQHLVLQLHPKVTKLFSLTMLTLSLLTVLLLLRKDGMVNCLPPIIGNQQLYISLLSTPVGIFTTVQ